MCASLMYRWLCLHPRIYMGVTHCLWLYWGGGYRLWLCWGGEAVSLVILWLASILVHTDGIKGQGSERVSQRAGGGGEHHCMMRLFTLCLFGSRISANNSFQRLSSTRGSFHTLLGVFVQEFVAVCVLCFIYSL